MNIQKCDLVTSSVTSLVCNTWLKIIVKQEYYGHKIDSCCITNYFETIGAAINMTKQSFYSCVGLCDKW